MRFVEARDVALASSVVLEFRPDAGVVLTGGRAAVELGREEYARVARMLCGRGADDPPSPDTLAALREHGYLVDGVVARPDAGEVASRADAVRIPARLGPYRVIDWIGSGAFGDVFEAIDLEQGDLCALKRLRRVDPEGVRTFKREVRSVADLLHPALIAPYEMMVIDGTWFFTMERIDGPSLLEFIRGGPTFTGYDHEVDRRLRDALLQLAEAVRALHHAGLLHLDLRPSNILVRADGRVAVLDFGLARHLGRPGLEAALVGTPVYMAPEQLMGLESTARCDWYAVGVMLHEALTGAPPFAGAGGVDLGRRLTRDPPDPRRLAPQIPAELAALCRGLLARVPEQRSDGAAVLACLAAAPAPMRPSGRRVPFVGRQELLAELHRLRARVASSGPIFTLLAGASGIGKSALAHHFAATVARSDDPGVTLFGRCHERESIPYKAVDAVVDQLAELLAAHGDALPPEVDPEGLAALAQSFPVMQRFARDAGPADTAAQQRQRAALGLKQCLRLVARGSPLIVLIDDIHWGDRDSMHLLIEVMSPPQPAPVLLLCSCHADSEASEFLSEWRSRSRQGLPFACVELTVGPLSLDESTTLARALLGPQAPPERAAELASAAVGSPYVIEELARDDGEASVAGAPLRGVDVGEVLGARIRRLGGEARHLLSLAAVAGRPIEQSLLLAAAGEAGSLPASGRHWLTVLRASSMVRGRGARGRDVVEVYHQRIRDSVLGGLAPAELGRYHAALAHVLARNDAELHELAHHWYAAGELHRAAQCARGAAARAESILAFDRAAEFYAKAIEWGEFAPGEAAELRAREAECLFNAGRSSEAAPRFMAAAEHASPSTRQSLQRRGMESWLLAGQIDEGLAALRPLLVHHGLRLPQSTVRAALAALWHLVELQLVDLAPARGAASPAEAERIDLCWSSGKGLVFQQPLTGILFMLQSLRRAQRAGDAFRAARVLAYMAAGLFFQIAPLRGVGTRYLERARAIGASLQDPYLDAACRLWQAMSEVYPGRWRAMLTEADEAQRLLRARCPGTQWERVIAGGVVAWALQFLGELGDSGARASEWLNEAVRHGDLYGQVLFSQYVAYADLAAGDVAAARRRSAWIVDAWTRQMYTITHAYAMLLLAMCDLYEGAPVRAEERFLADLPRMRGSGGLRVPMLRIDMLLLEGRIALQLEASGRASRRLRSPAIVARELQREQRGDARGHVEVLRAGHAALHARRDDALAGLRRAAAAYRAADMQLHALCCDVHLAAARDDPGREAIEAAIRRRGVLAPARWADLYAPGFAAP